MNHYTASRANFFMQEMREEHNERSLRADVMDTDFMPDARLAEVRAAYGISTTATRSEVAAHLLAGRSAWSQELLDAHRVAAGGRWRDVHAPAQGSRKRKAVA